ncbi:MAG: hypothetical protein K9N51_11560 [Candidatus Pacebacteria bacterium]|nr:hypothetical protein [Candidatus Paceibacterota bacterium]
MYQPVLFVSSYTDLMELAERYITDTQPSMESPAEVARYMRVLLHDSRQEEFHVLLVNTKNQLIGVKRVTIGLVDRSQVHAREVFFSAIESNASRVILCHNHPSGDPTPSAQDISCTKSLVSAGKIIGIEVLDHVIIGKKTRNRPRDYLSMREENLI